MSSTFVRQFRHRALRFLPRPTRPLEFQTRLDIQPKRFAIGLAERTRWPELSEARSAPMNVAFYVGRVLEVEPSGAVVVAIWESPSGRELRAALSMEEDFGGEAPSPGEVLRVWTWVELPGGGAQDARRLVRVRPVEPHEAEARRRRLREFLERSRAQSDEA